MICLSPFFIMVLLVFSLSFHCSSGFKSVLGHLHDMRPKTLHHMRFDVDNFPVHLFLFCCITIFSIVLLNF
ncbi:hypothetical protein BDV39DRAFT_26660 [Aspergillus sergii]|uniref:Uncharacterized protein n=1 Tax=Aspergillus sergii TaxID=1034303 RepID=A0A5N6WJB5_9EURO|nr:hypothetical protein BDV39DRAFT_26660 [Aspergillus sergii]